MTRRWATTAIAALLALSSCSSLDGPPAANLPRQDEAVAFLARLVDLAGQGEFEELCGLGDGNCERHLEMAGIESVPPEPPTVVASRLVADDPSSGAVGGWVLTLCGIDGRGQDYRSEMLIFRDGDGLRAINPVYWDGVMIADGNATVPGPQPTGC